MPELMHVRPADAGALILDPFTKEALPPEGKEVPADHYWIGLLNRGDVVPVQTEVAGDKAPKKKER